MKNKILVLTLLFTMAVPQIVSASWWNPLSWKVFNKTDTKTQVLENRVKELEAKLATSTPTTTKAPVVKKEVKKTTPVVDNSAIIQAQAKAKAEAELKARIDQEALIAKQKADEQARIEAIKAQQAIDRANEEAREEKLRIDAQTQKAQEKLDAMDAVNLKIANLNAKYAEDMKACNSGGGTVSGANACKNAKTNRYTDDYNALMAEWQLIKYSY